MRPQHNKFNKEDEGDESLQGGEPKMIQILPMFLLNTAIKPKAPKIYQTPLD